ncbi:hypothetical protein [Sedimenticola selenatireducens]|uniref:Uncharacterized protein n=1 Tax=Sedimenticola selenatireducens TaxID=191960 RepID=A0A2N6CX07_9GAMM|nr:hypothetical protein [Sedimenticola selenatireducens]PLX61820.1 MAG: hypothetical protein C0630_09825 [Sedimenticola selenatireducens]
MSHLLKKRFVIMLILFVSLLPYSFSHGFMAAATKAHPVSQQHTMKADCVQSATAAHCIYMTQNSPADEDCCGDHCDGSFGTQPGVAVEYGLQVCAGQLFQNASRIWTPGPIPATLLRPPSLRS